MKIEVWSDYVCPFCYIGKKRLEQALVAENLQDHVEVIFRAYQLDPNSSSSDKPMLENLAKKYRVRVEEARRMMENVAEQAKTVNLSYNIDGMKMVNTFDAHRLAKYAEQEGKGEEVSERLLHGYFVAGEPIGDREQLLTIAKEVGLSKEQSEEVLSSNQFADAVEKDQLRASQMGVQGVPFFVIHEKYAISGAQPTEVFAQALRKVADEEGIQSSLQLLGEDEEGICKDGKCSF